MKQGRASESAATSAAYRAVETKRPEHERVCCDPFAEYFLSGIYSLLARSRLLGKIGFWYSERKVPGSVGIFLARTRCIDDYLKECINGGIEQLVILGAGYDSRAYRFDELKGRVKVLEVDHPATQEMKMQKIKKILGYLPDYVVYVPVDFEKERLDDRLIESGYSKDLRTLFIWEGVIYYLTPESVDETLDFVANNSGGGSSIIFDYFFKSVVDGTSELEESKRFQRSKVKYERRWGEWYTFGIEEGTIDDFLSQRGFCQVVNANGESLRNAYFTGKNRSRLVFRGWATVHAQVRPREQA
jgi:methyltransferase (TIGR00027 family)